MSGKSGNRAESTLLISYLTLRKVVGLLGMLFPLAVALGYPLLLGSLSAYYYTSSRDIFVGTLWVIGFFLFAYTGYDLEDVIAAKLAWLFAVGTSVFPTDPDPHGPACLCSTAHPVLHYASAALLFATLSYFSLVLFTRTSGKPTKQKLQRNLVYKICGYTMLAAIAALAVLKVAFHSPQSIGPIPDPVFWLETLTVEAFGVSWMVKGEAILKDA